MCRKSHKSICLMFMLADSSDKLALAGDVAVSCLKIAISSFHGMNDHFKKLSAMIFPLLLIQPKVSVFCVSVSWFLKLTLRHQASIRNCFVDDICFYWNSAQTQKTNLKILELAKEQKLPFYHNLAVVSSKRKVKCLACDFYIDCGLKSWNCHLKHRWELAH